MYGVSFLSCEEEKRGDTKSRLQQCNVFLPIVTAGGVSSASARRPSGENMLIWALEFGRNVRRCFEHLTSLTGLFSSRSTSARSP